MYKCKFCGKEQKRYLSQGYCVSCYQYFILHNFKIYNPSEYGELSRVDDITDKQYNMPICHICGRAYTKLQQHIWYSHHMTKKEYCDRFGLDHGINMTTKEYNEKMSCYAYKYNMPEQLIRTGVDTRFSENNKSNYIRSYQTMQRLKQNTIIKKGNK